MNEIALLSILFDYPEYHQPLFLNNALKYIKQMALTTNVKYITFSSHRRGWSKRAVQYGFRPKLWICEV